MLVALRSYVPALVALRIILYVYYVCTHAYVTSGTTDSILAGGRWPVAEVVHRYVRTHHYKN